MLCYIWSIYLFALAVLPCSDNTECASNNQQVLMTATHSDHDHEEESCTPLCLCSCCGTQSISPFAQHVNPVFFDTGLKTGSVYSSVLLEDYPASIWQPPKSA
jgi:hypothetical protein